MNLFKIPSEQPPFNTESRLKEWLVRLIININAALEDARQYLTGIDSQIASIESDVATNASNIATNSSDIDAIELALPGMVADTSYRLTAISPAVDSAYRGWRDNISPIVVKGSGSNNPTWSVFRNGIYAYEFIGTGTSLKEFWSVFHIDHDYLVGSNMYPHVHFAVGNTNATGVVKWFMEYTVAKGHQQSAFAATTTVSQTISIDGTPYKHYVCELSAGISSAEFEPDSMILIRFYRDPADAGDTFAASVWGFTSDLHYQFDRYGTKNKAPNFYS